MVADIVLFQSDMEAIIEERKGIVQIVTINQQLDKSKTYHLPYYDTSYVSEQVFKSFSTLNCSYESIADGWLFIKNTHLFITNYFASERPQKCIRQEGII